MRIYGYPHIACLSIEYKSIKFRILRSKGLDDKYGHYPSIAVIDQTARSVYK